ncbi:MAG TPA: double-strand break repair protein AddB, partial [Alphaproteobacteria bacterium]|nr:double-strand break repair protein AddB [Alphaproteobacteria bacterium]
ALAVEEAEAGRLWAGEAGEAAAAFTAELAEHAGSLGDIAGAAYPALFEQLISGAVVRPQRSAHPRLFIWGPLEARLQHVERVVIAGLNEGSFPPEPEADPWLSRPMRESFGLPSLERRIGLSAHDFVQLFNAPEVFLTRARKVEGTPSVPSRWLVRLKALLDAEEGAPRLERQAPRWLAWQRALDRPQSFTPASPPSPAPPLNLRPRRLSVTEIETWMRDPYAIYARRVLKLEPLEPLDADFGAAERGEFIHRALDRFMSAYRDRLPEDALERLLALGREAFGPAFGRNAVWAFWWPRFRQIAQWFIDTEHARREGGLCTLASEIRGELALTGPAGPFALRAKADRIDRLVSGELSVIDYKTGAIPQKTQVRLGFAPQLPLEALIAEQGGFAEVPAAPVGELAYWQLKGGDKPGAIEPVNRPEIPLRELIEQARAGLERLIAAYDDPATPYPARPDAAAPAREGPYDHLARVKEWQAQDEGGES